LLNLLHLLEFFFGVPSLKIVPRNDGPLGVVDKLLDILYVVGWNIVHSINQAQIHLHLLVLLGMGQVPILGLGLLELSELILEHVKILRVLTQVVQHVLVHWVPHLASLDVW
jgi:hypothetical protein